MKLTLARACAMRPSQRRYRSRLTLAALLALPAAASAVTFEYSGFASVIAGQTFGGCTNGPTVSARFGQTCTRYIADWSHASVYTPSLSFKPESRLGLQGTARFNDKLSATTQVVARSVSGTRADLEWAYASYTPDLSWTLQAGRKRLPLFYFSDFQDVGYAYTWLRPPPDVYGWDVVNYNGANATWQHDLAGWNLKANFFAGDEQSKDNRYYTLIDSANPKDIRWKNIRGMTLEFNRGWFTGRAVAIASDYLQRDRLTDSYDIMNSGQALGKQRIWGFSANIDADPWVVRSEYSVFDRSNFQYKAKAYMLAAGYRIGKLTPMLTTSGYRETTPFVGTYEPLLMQTHAVTLRYEVGDSSAVKVQFDRFRDRNRAVPFGGTANVLAVGFDTVF